MLHRVEHLMKIDTRYIWGGTFHHIGNIILRQQSERVGYKRNFTILDNEDSKDMIDVVLKASKIDTKAKMFPKGSVLKGIFSYAVNTMTTIEETVNERTPFFYDIIEEITDLIQSLYGKEEGGQCHGLR